jgi:hypothetical protein
MARSKQETCTFVDSAGTRCPGTVNGKAALCFWHDPAARKTGKDVKRRLEAWARSGHSMEGFQLQHVDLRGVNLTREDARHSYNLSGANLSRANLHGAHLFGIDLRGSTLLKANLTGANLNRAKLENADLLGVNLDETRLEYVDWGRHVQQEDKARMAHREGRLEEAATLCGEAEEVYRTLSNVSASKGYFKLAGHFFQREMIMRRMQLSPWSWEWWLSKMVDLLCGYGERADRVIGFSLTVILLCALAFFFLGVSGAEGTIVFDPAAGARGNLLAFLACTYYSVVTFTTLGYGDIVPLGAARFFAAVEAFIGAFSIALFVVVFVKKMTR